MKRMAGIALALGLGLGGVAFAEDTSDKYKELDRLKDKDQQIALSFKGQELHKILGSLEKLSPITVTFGEGFPSGKKVTIDDKGSLKKVLIDLAEMNSLTYEVPSPDSLVVKGPAAKP